MLFDSFFFNKIILARKLAFCYIDTLTSQRDVNFMSEDYGKVSDEQKIKISCLSDALKRYDSYIGTVNFKCGLLMTFNIAVIGGVILKSKDFIAHDYTECWVIMALIYIAAASFLGCLAVIRTIWPNITSASTAPPSTENLESPSILFFGSVAKRFKAHEYAKRVGEIKYSELERDLAIQVHEVAVVTSDKFRRVSHAANCSKHSLYGLIVLLGLMIVQGAK